MLHGEKSGEKHDTSKALVLTLLDATGRGKVLPTPYIRFLDILAVLAFSLD